LSLHRRNPRRDMAEEGIVEALKRFGASVQKLSARDAPDLLVGWRGQTLLLEVKTPGKGKVSDGQAAWHAKWRGGAVHVVTTVAEALRALGLEVAS
jgi:hypothetical protein